MVSIHVRNRILRGKLLKIRNGPGAAILPPNVTKIHMEFAKKMDDGHIGPRLFWKENLARLKYYNPMVSMTVNRTKNQEGPALMTVYFNSSAATPSSQTEANSTATPSSTSEPESTPSATETSEIINMKHRHSDEILTNLLKITKATPVPMSPEDEELAKWVQKEEALAEQNSIMCKAAHAERKKQQAMLAAAKAGNVLDD